MFNLYAEFKKLLPKNPMFVGTVQSVADGVYTIDLPGGQKLTAKGVASVGQRVFVQSGQILGPAPALPVDEVEV